MDNFFKGFGVALVTPFSADGEIDFASLRNLVEEQMDAGVDFFCVLGSTAETPCLSLPERQKIKDFVVECVNGKVPLLLGFGGNNTMGLVEEIHCFNLSGVDGLLSVCPFYNKPSQEGIYRHFSTVAGAVDLPVVVYNVPGRTGVNMNAQTTLRLAHDVDNIVAIKEASGNIMQIEEIIENCPHGFEVLSGDDQLTYELITYGAAGVISVIGNAFPRYFGSMVHELLAEEYEKARKKNDTLAEVYPLLFMDGNPAGVKALLSMNGKIQNILRLPLVPASDETMRLLETCVKRVELS